MFKALVRPCVIRSPMPKRSDGMEGFKKSRPLVKAIESSKIGEQPSYSSMAVSNFPHNSRSIEPSLITILFKPLSTGFYAVLDR